MENCLSSRWSLKSTEIRKAIATLFTLFRQTDFCRIGCSQSRKFNALKDRCKHVLTLKFTSI